MTGASRRARLASSARPSSISIAVMLDTEMCSGGVVLTLFSVKASPRAKSLGIE
jgi:hypothetical protein